MTDIIDMLKAELREMPGISAEDASRAMTYAEAYRREAEALSRDGMDPFDIAEYIRRQVSRMIELDHDAKP